MNIDIIMHCWSRQLSHCAGQLSYSLSSLRLCRPKQCSVTATVCTEPKDRNTLEVLAYFADLVHIRTIIMPDEFHLGRRSIGRNFAAKGSVGDIVWFADVDQVYHEGCLDRLATMSWPAGASMVYPREIMIHKNHIIGDNRAEAVRKPRLVDIHLPEYGPKRYNRAIGGVQIVRGDFARKYGYLDGDNKWQQPSTKPFGDFKDDIAYRKACLNVGSIVGIDLPGMFRLRHTRTTYQGQ